MISYLTHHRVFEVIADEVCGGLLRILQNILRFARYSCQEIALSRDDHRPLEVPVKAWSERRHNDSLCPISIARVTLDKPKVLQLKD